MGTGSTTMASSRSRERQTGDPPERRLRPHRTAVAIALALLLTAITAGPALGAEVHLEKGGFDGIDTDAGAFAAIGRVAVHQASGAVYAIDNRGTGGVVDKFDAEGAAQDFSALSSSSLDGGDVTAPDGPVTFDLGSESDLAVDNSGMASDGRLYVLEEYGSTPHTAFAFDTAGNYLHKIDVAGADTCGIAVDSDGNVWIADFLTSSILEYDAAGAPTGNSISTAAQGNPCHIAFDSANNLYVAIWNGAVHKYDSAGAHQGLIDSDLTLSVAADPVTSNAFVVHPARISVYGPSGSPVESFGESTLTAAVGVGVRGTSGRVYVADQGDQRVHLFDSVLVPTVTTGAASAVTLTTATFDGQVDPDGEPVTECRFFYVDDVEFQTNGYANATGVDCSPAPGGGEDPVDVTADLAGLESDTTYHFRLQASNANGTVTGDDVTFHTEAGPPVITATQASQITDTRATLNAKVNRQSLATTYHFEYVDHASFVASGFDDATRTAESSAGSGPGAIPVAQDVAGLAPATTHHLRLVATNANGTTEGLEAVFATYPAQGAAQSCPNAAFRTGASAQLPRCRAYELVSPADANGLELFAFPAGAGTFATPLAAQDSAVFATANAILPGSQGTGSTANFYRSIRGPGGWSIESLGPSGTQSVSQQMGGISSDHLYSVLVVGGQGGSLDLPGPPFSSDFYLRRPDGTFDLVGRGSLADDPCAEPEYVTAGASHLIFSTGTICESTQLEPLAPADGIGAIYDRAGGATHVISLLPGDETPVSSAAYQGASEDGSTVAFTIGPSMYVRRNNTETHFVASGEPRFAGLSRDGERLFYFEPNDPFFGVDPGAEPYGDLFAFDVDSQTTIPIAGNDAATPVNASSDGSRVYFVSTEQLDGANGTVGADNLYAWDGSTSRFVAELDHTDLTGFYGEFFTRSVHLARWTEAVGPLQNAEVGIAKSPSRTTADGSVLVFESHANLTGYDDGGHSQIFRYDTASESLVCISCVPTGEPATSPARLQPTYPLENNSPTTAATRMANLTSDGKTVFFHSEDRLAPGDVNGTTDVYEWNEGRVALISSGKSGSPSFLTGVTQDGGDVFFKTQEALLPQDENAGSGAIYDARIGGGFPPIETSPPCTVGEDCQGLPARPPSEPVIGSSTFSGPGNQRAKKRCGKRKKLRNGRCVPRKRRSGGETRGKGGHA